MARTMALAMVVVMMALAQGAMATNHVVGGKFGWHFTQVQGIRRFFYQNWADSDAPYHFGDTLEFNYTPGDKIVRVEKDDFLVCDSSRSSWSVDGEGHSVLELAPPVVQAERVYFIDTDKVRCTLGMRFYIDVVA